MTADEVREAIADVQGIMDLIERLDPALADEARKCNPERGLLIFLAQRELERMEVERLHGREIPHPSHCDCKKCWPGMAASVNP